jgi:hypothetical protein
VWYRSFNVPENDEEVVYHTNVKEGGGETSECCNAVCWLSKKYHEITSDERDTISVI